jgi:hypothetical protein
MFLAFVNRDTKSQGKDEGIDCKRPANMSKDLQTCPRINKHVHAAM